MPGRRELKKILGEAGIRPSSRMGQNFLIDASSLRIIARSLRDRQPENGFDFVLEIGSGPGNLTQAMIEEDLNVVAIERDRRLARLCRQRLEGKNFTLLMADILHAPLGPAVRCGNMAVAGNLPYSITGEILRIITDDMPCAVVAAIVIQEEVAERLLSPPGRKAYGALTVLMDLRWDIERGIKIRAENFFPRPKVNSRHLVLTRKKDAGVEPGLYPLLRKIVRGAFSYRRKKMRSVISFILRDLRREVRDPQEIGGKAGIDPDLRPEALSSADFVRLTRIINQL